MSIKENEKEFNMRITFFVNDGIFTTEKFSSTKEALDYLTTDISEVLVHDLPSDDIKSAAIIIPNAKVSIIPTDGEKRSKLNIDPKTNWNEKDNHMRSSWFNEALARQYDLDSPDRLVENIDGEKICQGFMSPEEILHSLFKESDELDGEKQLIKDHRARIKGGKFAQAYFEKNIERLYGNPDWKDFRKNYDKKDNSHQIEDV